MRSRGEHLAKKGFAGENVHPVVVEAVVVDFHIVSALTEIKQRHIAGHSKTKYLQQQHNSSSSNFCSVPTKVKQRHIACHVKTMA